jgi:flagellar biogenesis protein FliO
MRLPFSLSLRSRRALVVYQLVLILIAIIVLILALLYIARRNQVGTTPATTSSMTVRVPAVKSPDIPLPRARAIA